MSDPKPDPMDPWFPWQDEPDDWPEDEFDHESRPGCDS